MLFNLIGLSGLFSFKFQTTMQSTTFPANESTLLSATPSWARLTDATSQCMMLLELCGKSLHLRGNCASHRMRSREAFDLETLACDLNLLSLVRTGTLALLSYSCAANCALSCKYRQLSAFVSTFVNFCLVYFRRLLTWLRFVQNQHRYRNG